MKLKHLAPLAIIVSAIGLSACANTIRGAGQDTANTVRAVDSAGNNVAGSVR
ncbi:entericidin domain-containing protein [Oryzicola mucosus]|uniref:Entericidin n=1 Tax=Oryzicola mucosus TaxID=2767425 RepID=A0A8J6PNW1_9HYPH|nr:entericidin [Oryzicola mucosus]MBD0414960.1 entericidin [Oryzicola mucosus]